MANAYDTAVTVAGLADEWQLKLRVADTIKTCRENGEDDDATASQVLDQVAEWLVENRPAGMVIDI